MHLQTIITIRRIGPFDRFSKIRGALIGLAPSRIFGIDPIIRAVLRTIIV